MPTDPLPTAAKMFPIDNIQRDTHALTVDLSLAANNAPDARDGGLGVARGLVNGLIFTVGLWLAITGFVLLIIHHASR